MMLPSLSRKTIPALNGVRAVAVWIVMLGHFGFTSIPAGHGVLVFFVLSGFLITWLLLNEAERTGDVSLRGFYFRRAIRILPAFYGFLLFVLALLLITKRAVCWPQVGYTMVYAANYYEALLYDPAHSNGVLAHIWSLAVEEQFYLVWPVAFWVMRRRPRLVTYALVSMIAAVWVYRAALILSGVSTRYVYRAFETRADHLLIGCLLAVLIKRELFKEFWTAVTRAGWMPFVPVAVVACSVAYAKGHPVYAHTVGYIVDPVLIAIAIVQLVALSSSPAWRWLDSRVVAWMGRVSYSLYLFQAVGLGPYVLPGRPMWLRFVLCSMVTVAMAATSYYLIERPFLRLKERRTRASTVVLRTEAAA